MLQNENGFLQSETIEELNTLLMSKAWKLNGGKIKVLNAQDIEDVVQDVFEYLWSEDVPSYIREDNTHRQKWAYTRLKSRIIDRIRQAKVRGYVGFDEHVDGLEAEKYETPQDVKIKREHFKYQVECAVQRLSAPERALVYTLAEYEGSRKMAARQLGKSYAQVRKAVSRLHKKMENPTQ